MQTITELASELAPFWQSAIDALRDELQANLGTLTGGSSSTETLTLHDLLGAFHELPTVSAGAVLIGPELSSGDPAFRSLTITDINAALASRSVGAGSGISGGGNLGSNISIAVDQGYSFVWTAAHTFNSAPTFMTGATVQGTSPIVFGGGLGDTLALARTSAITMTLAGSSGASVFEASIVRGVGTAAGFTLDDRVLNDGVTSRWFLHVNSGIWQWKYGPGAATTILNLDRFGSMRSPNYVSQTTGANVDFGIGAGDFRYLFADELHAKSFIADLEQALAGGQIITKSVTILARNFTAPAAGASTTLTVEDLPSAAGMQVFVNSDFVGVRNFNRSGGSLDVSYAWGTVTLDTTYTRTLTTTATGGTFTLTSTTTTAAIAFNAATTAVQSALEALASIGAGNVSVTGSPGAWVIRFIGTLADSSVALSVNGAGLTGGTATLTPSGYDSTTKTQRYTFTRSATADAGKMTAGTVIAADAIILDFGTPGNGIAEVTAVDGLNGINSPYYRIATFATHPRLMTERTRMGNLRGITGVANEFGLWAGNSIAGATLNGAINSSVTTITVDDTSGFPTAGEIVIETERITYTGKSGTQFTGCTRGVNGTAAAAHANGERVNECGVNAGKSWMRMSTQSFALNNLDFEIWRAGIRRFRVDSATPYLALGSPNPTSYLGGTGFFVGDNGSGVYRLHVGSASGGTLTEGVSWSGSVLDIRAASNAVRIGSFGVRLNGVLGQAGAGSINWYDDALVHPITGLPGAEILSMNQNGIQTRGDYTINVGGGWGNGMWQSPANFRVDALSHKLSFDGGSIISGPDLNISSIQFDITFKGTGNTNSTLAVNQQRVSIGNSSYNYVPSSGNWSTTGSTLLINSSQTSSIAFHDSLDTVGFITFSGADGFRIGYDYAGYGVKGLTVAGGLNVGPTSGAGVGHIKLTGGISIEQTQPFITLYETDAAVDNRRWEIAAAGEVMYFSALNDAYSSGSNFMRVDRTGTTIDSVAIPNGRFGVGMTAPAQKLHVIDSGAGWATVQFSGLTTGTITVVSSGAASYAMAMGVISESGGSRFNVPFIDATNATKAVAPNNSSVDLYNSGGNVLRMSVSAGGAITITRPSGTTWAGVLWILYR